MSRPVNRLEAEQGVLSNCIHLGHGAPQPETASTRVTGAVADEQLGDGTGPTSLTIATPQACRFRPERDGHK